MGNKLKIRMMCVMLKTELIGHKVWSDKYIDI